MITPDDTQFPEILDDYLSKLQAGKRPDREALLREHPELEGSLKCLEALNGLVPVENTDPDLEALLFENHTLPCDFGPYRLLEEIGRGAWVWFTRRGKRASTASWPSR